VHQKLVVDSLISFLHDFSAAAEVRSLGVRAEPLRHLSLGLQGTHEQANDVKFGSNLLQHVGTCLSHSQHAKHDRQLQKYEYYNKHVHGILPFDQEHQQRRGRDAQQVVALAVSPHTDAL
jgi:hypothetical protein